MISALFFFIFGIIGINFLKGRYYICDTSSIGDFVYFYKDKMDNKYDCLNFGGEWVRFKNSFDNLTLSLITIFAMSQSFDWSDVMYMAMSSRGIDMIPE
jgi:hypothetical protein